MRVELQSINSTIMSMQRSFAQILESRLAEVTLPEDFNKAVPSTSESTHHSQQAQLVSSSWRSSTAYELSDESMIESSVGNRLLVESVAVQAPQSSLCNCDCHSSLAVNTPQWLGSALGTLLIRYNKDPRSCRNCANKDCRKGAQSVLKTKYYFPR